RRRPEASPPHGVTAGAVSQQRKSKRTENMKRYLAMLAAAAAIVLTSASCTKEGVRRFSGNYSFKTSGSIEAAITGYEILGTQTIPLTAESGQLSVVTSDKSEGDMIVAMNILGGNLITFNANADGKTLTIEPFTRSLTLMMGTSLSDLTTLTTTVTVSGSAQRYDDSLLFNLTYEGGFTYQSMDFTIVSSDVECWAKSND
ncbi:MAG: hypothetical protein LUD50_01470, partial [Clostridia bacterium]|nr:hypothetical protein [Clostridia bacterium]